MTKTDQSFLQSLLRNVVREELATTKSQLKEELLEALRKMNEETFARYRDAVLTKMDAFIKEVRDFRDQQSGHQIQHNDLRSELNQLDAIHPQGHHANP